MTVKSSGGAVGTDAVYSFDSLTVGSTATETFTITNEGDAELTLNGVSTESGTNFGAESTYTGDIMPGESKTFQVEFHPASAGTLTDTVSISSNEAGSPFRFGVSGTATPATEPLAPPSWIQGTWWQSGGTASDHNEYAFSSDNVVNTLVMSGAVISTMDFKQKNSEWAAQGAADSGYFDSGASPYLIEIKGGGTVTGTLTFTQSSATQLTLVISGTGGGTYTFNKQP